MVMAMAKTYATKALRHKYYFKKIKKPSQLCLSPALHLSNKNLYLQNGISNWRNRFSRLTFIASFN